MSRSPADLIRLIEERDEFVTMDDGFVHWWPTLKSVRHSTGGYTGGGGSFDAETLKIIAAELDRRNAAWGAEIDKYFEEHPEPPCQDFPFPSK